VLGLAPNLVLTLLFLAIIGCCVAMAMPMVHIVAYCSDLGFAAARGAEMLSLLLGSAVISRLLFGGLADRIGALPTLLISSGLQALALALYAWVDTLFGLYALSIGFGLVFGGIVPSYALAVRELFPESEAGWRIGVVFLGGTIGMALGGWLGGAIFDVTGAYHAAFLTGLAFNLGNIVLVVLLVWRRGGGSNVVVTPAPA
jgi:MFS family permease